MEQIELFTEKKKVCIVNFARNSKYWTLAQHQEVKRLCKRRLEISDDDNFTVEINDVTLPELDPGLSGREIYNVVDDFMRQFFQSGLALDVCIVGDCDHLVFLCVVNTLKDIIMPVFNIDYSAAYETGWHWREIPYGD